MELSSLLAGLAGMGLSLAFRFVPGLSGWYEGRDSQTKSLVMLGFLLLAAVGAYGASCWQIFAVPGLSCEAGAWRVLLAAFLSALAANQTTYTITRRVGGSTGMDAMDVDAMDVDGHGQARTGTDG